MKLNNYIFCKQKPPRPISLHESLNTAVIPGKGKLVIYWAELKGTKENIKKDILQCCSLLLTLEVLSERGLRVSTPINTGVSGGDTVQGQAFGDDGFYISRGSLRSLSGIFNDDMIEQGL